MVAAGTRARRTDARALAAALVAAALGCEPGREHPLQAPTPHDPIDRDGRFTSYFWEPESREVYQRLKGFIEPESSRRRLADARLAFLDMEMMQAGAGCNERTHRPYVMVTRGLLTLIAALSEAVAVDAVTGGDMVERLRAHVVDLRGRRAPWAPLPIALVPAALRRDPAKLARQRAEFDAMMAFVLAHEVSHHARAQTACMSEDGGVMADTTARELQADEGAGRMLVRARPPDPTARWTATASLRVMTFLDAIDRTRGDAASPFSEDHPPWAMRRPVLLRAMREAGDVDAGDEADAAR